MTPRLTFYSKPLGGEYHVLIYFTTHLWLTVWDFNCGECGNQQKQQPKWNKHWAKVKTGVAADS